MSKPIIVGITGRMRSGKSTLAHTLGNGSTRVVISFAEYVRREVADSFFGNWEWPLRKLQELEAANKSTIRPILQAFGHGKRILIDNNYWVNKLATDVAKNHQDKDIVFIDDVRYVNEIEYIMNHGGYIVRLSCDDEILIERGASADALLHPSENNIDPDNLTLAESAKPSHVLMLDSGSADKIQIARWTTRWLQTFDLFRDISLSPDEE